MKKQLHSLGLGLLLALGASPGFAQSTEFTYQGRLTDNGAPAQTAKEMRFTLCSDPVGSTVPGLSKPNPTPAVPVTPVNGLFTVKLDFGSEAFAGAKRFLRIEVKPQGAPDTDYVALQPMSELTVAPYAIFASKAGDFVAGASPTFTGTPSFNGPGAPFTVGNNNKVANLNADLLDSLDSVEFVRKSVDSTITATLTVNGTSAAVLGNVSSGSSGAGVKGTSTSLNGNGVIGEANNGDSAYGVWGKSSLGFAGRFNGRVKIDGQTTLTASSDALLSTATGGSSTGVTGESTGINGNGVVGEANNGSLAYGIWGKSMSGFAGFFEGIVKIEEDSNINRPHLSLHETIDGDYARLEFQDAARPKWHIAVGGGAVNQMNFWNSVNGDVMQLKENGQLSVRCLTILGGCDLAEPFEMSQEQIPVGAVVAIDENNPGKLKLSDRAYDTRVAGVVSGANGVAAGVTLRQEGVLDRGQNVALTGRVYAQADASASPIRPGDLLTTSDTPGHVMKASDRDRAQGAVIGKAMSALDSGKGMVLVLVNLQ